jgi:hypothetical protein
VKSFLQLVEPAIFPVFLKSKALGFILKTLFAASPALSADLAGYQGFKEALLDERKTLGGASGAELH